MSSTKVIHRLSGPSARLAEGSGGSGGGSSSDRQGIIGGGGGLSMGREIVYGPLSPRTKIKGLYIHFWFVYTFLVDLYIQCVYTGGRSVYTTGVFYGGNQHSGWC